MATMKYVKKEKLQFIDGLICDKKGRALGINPEIARLANQLETKVQERDYLNKQPMAQPMPSLDGFERKHMHELKAPHIKPVSSPVTDKRIADAMAFVQEVEEQHAVDLVNKEADKYALLFDFVINDRVWVSTDVCEGYEFDTPILGNPLEYNADDILCAIAYLFDAAGYKED